MGPGRPDADLPQQRERGRGGKLKAAARIWASGGASDLGEAIADAERAEIPGLAEKLRASAEQETGFKVWRRNWNILIAFLSVSSQWRTVATATGAVYWQGLDYTAVRAGLEGDGVRITPSLWAGIRTMERAARDVLNGVRG